MRRSTSMDAPLNKVMAAYPAAQAKWFLTSKKRERGDEDNQRQARAGHGRIRP